MPNRMEIFRREPPNGGVECRCGRQKTGFWTNIWLLCIQVYSVVNRTSREVSKTKPRRTAASVEHSLRRPSSVVRIRRRRSVCDELDVIRRRGQTSPDTTPLVMTPFSAAVGHRRTEPGGYFCRKLTLTRTPDPIRPTRRGPDTNRPTSGSKQGRGSMGVSPGRFGRTPPETTGDSRTEFNRILCSSKSEAAVVINKKLSYR